MLKLADFGLACTVDESRRRISVCGTRKLSTHFSLWAIGILFSKLCFSRNHQRLAIRHPFSNAESFVTINIHSLNSLIICRKCEPLFLGFGHSVFSEYWAVACTFYFMHCGSTPFQTSTIKGTYARICRSDYAWPDEFAGSARAKDFISRYVASARFVEATYAFIFL